MAGGEKVKSRKRSGDEDGVASSKLNKENSDFDLDLSRDIKGIIQALHQIRDKAHKDGQKKTEETITSLASEIRIMLDEAKRKLEKERQAFAKTLTKNSKECESVLKDESTKFQAAYEKFCKDKTSHLQAYNEIFSKFEDEKEKLFACYEQQRKKEKIMISDLEKACADKIAAAEGSLKKKKQQDDKSFNILRKSLGSFLDSGSDED
ncbi:hypothetical protein AMTRI_Chr11g98870 [Amborella trichopoda]